MTEFMDAATSPVALVFGVPLAISLVLWLVGALGVLDFDGDALDGTLGDALDGVGMAGVPPLVVITIVSLIGWFVSVIAAMFLLDPVEGIALVGVSVLIFVVSLVSALYLGAKVARPLGSMMETARAPHDDELIGHEAVIRSGRVDETFGYADATWDDGTMSRIEVRAPADRGLTAGDLVRLIGWDRELRIYKVVRDKEIFNETGDN
ncbi:MAG: hypothetical protein GY708_24665 [Actinomycetia bacterium]|nr:hypothetical protein [Actinomycetes bacterium]MCP4960008.1 hypothetical protein [Actinomycetes bacterium]